MKDGEMLEVLGIEAMRAMTPQRLYTEQLLKASLDYTGQRPQCESP